MTKTELMPFLELQKQDLAIEEFSKQLVVLPRNADQYRTKILAAQTRLEEFKKNYTEIQIKKKNCEMEVSSLEEKIKKNEKELNTVKSNDIYRALLSEIAAAKEQRSKIEEEILGIMIATDTHNAESKKVSAEVQSAVAALELEIKKVEEQVALCSKQKEELEQKRAAFAQTLPQDIFSRYEMIRLQKKTFAIAVVENDICGGCHQTLTPRVLNDLKRAKEIQFCETCSRILMVKPQAPAVPPESATLSPQ